MLRRSRIYSEGIPVSESDTAWNNASLSENILVRSQQQKMAHDSYDYGRCEQVNPVNRSHVSAWLNVTCSWTPDPFSSLSLYAELTINQTQNLKRSFIDVIFQTIWRGRDVSNKMATRRSDDGRSEGITKARMCSNNFHPHNKLPWTNSAAIPT